ncbi:hypothetical protein C5167_033151 [Papaver somniferum]|uniref:Uncharacterized protein n=1 Tax=Papaver somniferum TaxID=3469 RepID=A0A4Y7K9G1_PAPSO|nr:hypothetical protein C5167_033151 [Papaver somniferum]
MKHDKDKLELQLINNYGHLDFIFATNANDLVFKQMIAFIKRQPSPVFTTSNMLDNTIWGGKANYDKRFAFQITKKINSDKNEDKQNLHQSHLLEHETSRADCEPSLTLIQLHPSLKAGDSPYPPRLLVFSLTVHRRSQKSAVKHNK